MSDEHDLPGLDNPEAWAEALERSRRPRMNVVCSNKAQHGAITLDVFELLPDGGVLEVGARQQAFPNGGGLTEDGASIANRATVRAETAWDGYKWRFNCPKCGRDVPLSMANLTNALGALHAKGRKSLDVSRLRR